MVDFKKALQAGLKAHENAEAARVEIGAVVKDLSSQVQDATGGDVGVELAQSTRQKVRYLTNALAVLSGNDKEVTNVAYTALFARRLHAPEARLELAEIEIDPAGYPVWVAAPNVGDHSYDRASLERTLAQLLEHPDTGGKIQRLLAMKPSSAPPRSADEGEP
jgi:hypothetical protein